MVGFDCEQRTAVKTMSKSASATACDVSMPSLFIFLDNMFMKSCLCFGLARNAFFFPLYGLGKSYFCTNHSCSSTTTSAVFSSWPVVITSKDNRAIGVPRLHKLHVCRTNVFKCLTTFPRNPLQQHTTINNMIIITRIMCSE